MRSLIQSVRLCSFFALAGVSRSTRLTRSIAELTEGLDKVIPVEILRQAKGTSASSSDPCFILTCRSAGFAILTVVKAGKAAYPTSPLVSAHRVSCSRARTGFLFSARAGTGVVVARLQDGGA